MVADCSVTIGNDKFYTNDKIITLPHILIGTSGSAADAQQLHDAVKEAPLESITIRWLKNWLRAFKDNELTLLVVTKTELVMLCHKGGEYIPPLSLAFYSIGAGADIVLGYLSKVALEKHVEQDDANNAIILTASLINGVSPQCTFAQLAR